jgi:isopenicillin N synthase-like dioxygenase
MAKQVASGGRRARVQADDAQLLPCESARVRRTQAVLTRPQTCHRLHVNVMRAVALGLDLDERFFDEKIDEQ